MNNSMISGIFSDIADILEILGGNPFRIRAYRRAAQAIENLSEDVSLHAESNDLTKLPGIGEDLASKIREYLATGNISDYDKLKKKIKPVALDMLSIPGVGPKTAKLLYDNLKVKSLEDLECKAKAHKIRGIPGVKDKTEENILRGLDFLKKDAGRMHLDTAFTAAQYVIRELKKSSQVIKISPAGSLRRMKETVRDIDILVTAKRSRKIIDTFVSLPTVKSVVAKGPTKSSIVTGDNVRIDLRVVPPESYGAALMYFTGSRAHNIKMRHLARKKGLKINEYGVFRLKGNKKIAGKGESGIYTLFQMPYIEPELREDAGEIDMALEGKLPGLVRLKDIKGDIHVHTKESDGHLSLKEIAETGKRKGYGYIAITDHSQSLRIAGGLSVKRLLKSIERVRIFNKGSKGPMLLIGAEVDILDDGSMDYSDEILEKLDFVIGAVHSGFKQPEAKLTGRIIKAIRNRYVNLIAHPSGRLIGRRDAYELDYEKIFKAAKDTGTALEINADPKRLDLTDVRSRRARELGVKLAICTDSHTEAHFDNMIYGLSVARRGWLEKKDLLNCMPLKQLKRFVESKRKN
ncbi:MAG: DNA polymerase/3'-5' exonuclease PolX [Candidatus Omnitrophica bacterium]|nr:DNA polymerase/3'-5' exonuclease PolX [Candidatus Omnitrophota bacterium]